MRLRWASRSTAMSEQTGKRCMNHWTGARLLLHPPVSRGARGEAVGKGSGRGGVGWVQHQVEPARLDMAVDDASRDGAVSDPTCHI